MKKPFEPNFNTPQDLYCKEEVNKINSKGMRGNLNKELRENNPEISWECDQLAKSYGFYMEFNRAKPATEKECIYMIRIAIAGGGPLSKQQWQIIDDLSEKFCKDPNGTPNIRLTNRQAIQFHWVKKENLLEIIKTLAENGLNTLNGCGDNTRNVMACPLSTHSSIFNANALTKKIAEYFQLPLDPFIEIFEIDPNYLRKPEESFTYGPSLLNRKFKIAVASVIKNQETGNPEIDNCIELLTQDCGILPVIEGDQINQFQIYIGGGQGERNGKPSLSTLAQPLTIIKKDQLMDVLDAIVSFHQNYGDRQNRFWARLKYVVKAKGIDYIREEVSKNLDFDLPKADTSIDFGVRHLHHGWINQSEEQFLSFGAFIENGRLTDKSPNGKLKSMVRELMNKYPVQLMISANQDLIFTDIPADKKDGFQKDLQSFDFGKRNGDEYSQLRLHSGACVGKDTCRLTYTDSEKFEPLLIDELEKLGWGDIEESIGITGCERQCFRPATKTIGLVGSGLNRYQFKLFGDVSGKFQGKPLISENNEGIHLRAVPREKVAPTINILLQWHKDNCENSENLGSYLRRIGSQSIIDYLKNNPETSELMEKPFNANCVID
ncbi:Sulfite reductase [NADPH] hemoprotein beta-component [hydrothermal vent metagenome]|uniref:Sulfite reductase [NADPH] hemoprotein beta-component n=1 Tax=hydrothermal vent metagenome TaxID=652676 RepID=A0A3B0T422_9ZZZZ